MGHAGGNGLGFLDWVAIQSLRHLLLGNVIPTQCTLGPVRSL